MLLLVSFALCLCLGCKKQNDWLDIKSAKSNVVPETIKDFQAIMDNQSFLCEHFISTGLVSSDNLIIGATDLEGQLEHERNLYLWNKSIWSGGVSVEWVNYFRAIAMANLVIEGMGKIDKSQPGYNNIMGQAYFHRAMNYFTLAQLFCKPYISATANSDLGLPVRLSPAVNVNVQRSSIKQLYDQMISDASVAISLLNPTQIYLQRPSAIAAKALLAKIYFIQEDYPTAEKYASEVLTIKPELIDYNNPAQVSESFAYKFNPYGKENPEVLFYAEGGGYMSTLGFLGNVGFVSPELFQTYSDDDLRKTTLYGQSGEDYNFVGSYTGSFNVFYGLATNEVYFIRAECKARQGNFQSGLDDVNHLLLSRFKPGTLMPITASNVDEALVKILSERRKELPNVGNIRWEDLRRLNNDPRFRQTLTRTVNGQTYSLLPNDPRYVLPIPEQEIQMSGIAQNVR